MQPTDQLTNEVPTKTANQASKRPTNQPASKEQLKTGLLPADQLEKLFNDMRILTPD
jgi:hypothetical protein